MKLFLTVSLVLWAVANATNHPEERQSIDASAAQGFFGSSGSSAPSRQNSRRESPSMSQNSRPSMTQTSSSSASRPSMTQSSFVSSRPSRPVQSFKPSPKPNTNTFVVNKESKFSNVHLSKPVALNFHDDLSAQSIDESNDLVYDTENDYMEHYVDETFDEDDLNIEYGYNDMNEYSSDSDLSEEYNQEEEDYTVQSNVEEPVYSHDTMKYQEGNQMKNCHHMKRQQVDNSKVYFNGKPLVGSLKQHINVRPIARRTQTHPRYSPYKIINAPRYQPRDY